jgi:undecaprenyl-diphosphatase
MAGRHDRGSMDGQVAQEEAMVGPAAVEPPTEFRPSRLALLLHLDELLLLGMRRFHVPWRTRVARGLTRAGDASSWVTVGLVLLATLRMPFLHMGLRLGAGAGIATLVAQLLKRGLLRPRPSRAIAGFFPLAENPDLFSFPSGHTAAAFAVALALAGEPFGAGPLALLLACGIGLSRVYLGAHYPLDVGAGAALGSVAGLLSRLVVP